MPVPGVEGPIGDVGSDARPLRTGTDTTGGGLVTGVGLPVGVAVAPSGVAALVSGGSASAVGAAATTPPPTMATNAKTCRASRFMLGPPSPRVGCEPMTRIRLVRHAEPAASWDEHRDPGLSPLGARQADELAARLAPARPAALVSSPLTRARATAASIAAACNLTVRVEPAVGEVPTPAGERSAWLRTLLASRWATVDDATRRWRQRVLDGLAAVEADTVVSTHFVAINVAVGAATGDERVWCCSPAHASVTELTVGDGALTLVNLGAESASRVS